MYPQIQIRHLGAFGNKMDTTGMFPRFTYSMFSKKHPSESDLQIQKIQENRKFAKNLTKKTK